MVTTSDYRRIIDPSKLPRDLEAEAKDAERVRRSEVEALLVERQGVLQRREAKAAEPLDEKLIILDADGQPTNLRIERIPVKAVRAQHDAEVARIDDALAVIDDALIARGYAS